MPLITFTSVSGELIIADAEHLTPEQEESLIDQAQPRTKPSLLKAFTQLRTREIRWQAQATEAQRAIGWGDHWAYRWDGEAVIADLALPACTIYGQVYTRQQIRDLERRAGAGEVELGKTLADLDAAHRGGWRHGRAWSAVSPDGEVGDTHVAVMTPITPRQFNEARRAGWPAEIPA